jgi:hypothetical protein
MMCRRLMLTGLVLFGCLSMMLGSLRAEMRGL